MVSRRFCIGFGVLGRWHQKAKKLMDTVKTKLPTEVRNNNAALQSTVLHFTCLSELYSSLPLTL